MCENRQVNVGDSVVYHDPIGRPNNALVTAVWSQPYSSIGCVNLVMVNDNEAQTDSYGRQITRSTSVCHKKSMLVHGNYWRFSDEEPNKVADPEQK